MSYAPLTCPFCNAYVQAPNVTVRHGRLICPRCGEAFTLPSGAFSGQETVTGPRPELLVDDTAMSPREKPRGRNRLVAAIILLVMAAMAGMTLVYALMTTDMRRAHDSGRSQSNSRLPIPTEATTAGPTGPVAPANLDALDWLPPDTSLILGVHLAEIGDIKAGQALLEQPIAVGGREVKIDDLLHWTGVDRANVDHLVLGFKIEEPLIPRMTLVLHTKRRYDSDALRKKLKAERKPDANGRRLDSFRMANPPLEPVFWCADDHTIVYGLVPSDVKDAPLEPRHDLRQLPREIREVLQERVKSVGPLWIAGTADDWTKTLVAQLLGNVKAEDRARLNRIRTFAAWVELDQTATLKAAFDCRDEASAESIEEYLRRLSKTDNSDLQLAREQAWVTLQWRAKVDTIRRALER